MAQDPEFDRLRSEIDELFADLWQVSRFSGRRRGFRPQLDCYRTDDPPRFVVVVDLAGIDPDDVKLVATGRSLVIAGERRRPHAEGRVYQQIEIDYGPFARQIALAEDVDTSAAEASYERGLLTITLPIAPRPAAGERVPIRVRRLS